MTGPSSASQRHATTAACSARDVPPGHSWAFRDHRPLAETGMSDHDLILAIQERLDGVEWTVDTLNEIAALLQNCGYDVRDLDDRVRA
jgi:hypothetical protein